MLVRTPSPMATESLLGYVLRLSERNGYDTPWRVLSFANIPRRQALSLDFPVAQLTEQLKLPSGSLDVISYAARQASGAVEYKILNIELGSRVRKGTFRFAQPTFCPACVQELGFLEAHWDIRLLTCCSRHRCALLSHCPSCLKAISWFRPGLLTCTCGASWNSAALCEAAPPQVALNTLLTAKILGQEISLATDAGFPEELTALPTRALLTIIAMLSDVLLHKASDNVPTQSIEQLFCRWPHGYLEFLDSLTQKRRISSFARTMLRSQLPKQTMKFLFDPVQQRLPSSPSTIKQSTSGTTKNRPSQLFEEAPRESLGDRQAAAFLGVPVSTLNSLRTEGHFRVRHLATPRAAYHCRDLEACRAEFLDVAKNVPHPFDDTSYVSLGEILKHWKIGDSAGKLNLLLSIRDGTITSYVSENSATTVSEIHLRRTDAEGHLARIRQFDPHKALCPYEVSKVIHCDPEVVVGLVEQGHLQGEKTSTTVRISQSAVSDFNARFVSIAWLSNMWKTSSRRLIRLCNEHSIETIDIPRRRSGAQPFIRRCETQRLSIAAVPTR